MSVWAIASNCWMNAVIAHQVHKMLKISHGRGRYTPPTRMRVAKEAMCVYVYAAFLACVSAWQITGVPLKSGSYRGFVCFPKNYDTASTLFFWLVFCPLYLFIPAFYVMWCGADILRKKMIPPAGRRRTLTIYFSRIVLVFIVMWIPYFLLAFIIGPSLPSLEAAWVIWAACVIAHLQGLVNVILCANKPDVKRCVLNTLSLLTLGYCGGEDGAEGDGQRGESMRFSSIGSSMINYLSKRRASATKEVDGELPNTTLELHSAVTRTSEIDRSKYSIDKDLGEEWDEGQDEMQYQDEDGGAPSIITSRSIFVGDVPQSTSSYWGRVGDEVQDEEQAIEQDKTNVT